MYAVREVAGSFPLVGGCLPFGRHWSQRLVAFAVGTAPDQTTRPRLLPSVSTPIICKAVIGTRLTTPKRRDYFLRGLVHTSPKRLFPCASVATAPLYCPPRKAVASGGGFKKTPVQVIAALARGFDTRHPFGFHGLSTDYNGAAIASRRHYNTHPLFLQAFFYSLFAERLFVVGFKKTACPRIPQLSIR